MPKTSFDLLAASPKTETYRFDGETLFKAFAEAVDGSRESSNGPRQGQGQAAPHNTYRASIEDSIKFYADRPFAAGFFAWTGFDYRGEPSPFGWPHISSSYGTLSAEGYQKGKKILEEKVETTGVPVAIRLVPDRTALHGDGEDVSLVTVEAVDDHGRTVPTADNLVHFHVDGGTIIGVGNGDAECLEADHGDQRSLYNGLAQVIVQTPPRAGKMTLTANSPGLSAATVALDADGSGPRPFVP